MVNDLSCSLSLAIAYGLFLLGFSLSIFFFFLLGIVYGLFSFEANRHWNIMHKC